MKPPWHGNKDQTYWPFVRGIHHSPVDSPHKWASNERLWRVLWFECKQTVEQIVELPIIWDDMTSVQCTQQMPKNSYDIYIYVCSHIHISNTRCISQCLWINLLWTYATILSWFCRYFCHGLNVCISVRNTIMWAYFTYLGFNSV